MPNLRLMTNRKTLVPDDWRKAGVGERSVSIRTAGQHSRTKALWIAKVAFEELAESFIEQGIPSQVAERLLRAAYVRETAKDVRRGWGEQPNVSQISVKTGLDRHLVSRILKNQALALTIPEGRRNPIRRVTDGWLSDPQYSTRKGPRDLPIGDKHSKERCVHTLVERYAPGVSARLIVDELLRVNLVISRPNGKLRWVGGNSTAQLFMPAAEDQAASTHLRGALKALLRVGPLAQSKAIWRKAQSQPVRVSDVPLLRKMLRERVEQMFSWLNDELSSSRWGPVEDGETGVRFELLGLTLEETVRKEKKNERDTNAARSKR